MILPGSCREGGWFHGERWGVPDLSKKMRESSSKQAACKQAKTWAKGNSCSPARPLPYGFHFEDSCVGRTFGLKLARLAHPHSLGGAVPAPVLRERQWPPALGLTAHRGRGTHHRRWCVPQRQQLPYRLCPSPHCPTRRPLVLPFSTTGVGPHLLAKPPLTTLHQMNLISTGFLST